MNGVKRFITNGDAHIVWLWLEAKRELLMLEVFLLFMTVRIKVTVRRLENKLGIKGSPTCELVFKNAPAS